MGVLRINVDGQWVDVGVATNPNSWAPGSSTSRPAESAPITSGWGQAVHDKTFAFGWATSTQTTDANGWWIIPPSAFGLSVVAGGVASVRFDGAGGTMNDTVYASEVQPGPGGNQLQGRCSQIWTDPNIHWGFNTARIVVVYAFAWGTPA